MDGQTIRQVFFAHASSVRAIIVILSTLAVIVTGQIGRELLPPDDLREAEVAREMYVGGDYIIPHLSGIPFIEKPSGFPFIVMTAYKIAGRPSEIAARSVSTAFAFVSLLFVFLLGKRIFGSEGGAFTAAILGLSMRFSRTAHEILLDNALTATIAMALFFSWVALDTIDHGKKRRAYAAMGFALGLSFVFKGFIGAAIFASGIFLYIILSGCFSEFRHVFSILPVAAFLFPVLSWLIPFLLEAPPDIIHEFIIRNHLHRFFTAYQSNERPLYFYLMNIWIDFIPGGIILPLSVFMVWRSRSEPENRAGMFFLCLFVTALVLLSLSRAMDLVYFLPVQPVMAMLVACSIWKEGMFERGWMRIVLWVIMSAAAVWSAAMSAITGIWGGNMLVVAVSAFISIFVISAGTVSIRKNILCWTGTCFVILCALSWCLWFTGPIARSEIEKKSIKKEMDTALEIVGGRRILLFMPNDGLRGYAGFYGNGTAKEIISPDEAVSLLAQNPDSAVTLTFSRESNMIPKALADAAGNEGKALNIEQSVDFGNKFLLIITAGP